MDAPELAGRRVRLAGHAEPALVEATRDAFADVRATVVDAEADGDPGHAEHIAIVFARRPSAVPLLGTDDGALESEIERLWLGPQRLALAAARRMAAGDGGAIVLVGTVDATHAYPARAAASVAMGGLLGLTRSMGVELASRGVRANLVIAGPVGSEDGAPPTGADRPTVERTLLRAPTHRFARPSEVAAAIRFVAGPDAAFMTGQSLRVDGGWASLNQAPEGMRFP